MKIFNLKTAARTLIFLKEHGIDSYEELAQKSAAASRDFHQVSSRLKEIGERKKAITELQKQIGTYGKTRETYQRYLVSGSVIRSYPAFSSGFKSVFRKYSLLAKC
ncbi:MAG: hypothetical protein LBR76_04175 [Oscillospiraceae bacterium]|jgi:DNA repair exonuclease SbcCD ATPase subunit|nr:hypothetical protein [Oscillospiraceae bacterium]